MVRRVRIRSVAFGIAMLIVAQPFLEVRKRAFGQEVSKDAKADLKERDRLWDQTHKLRAAGKHAEAIAAAEAMLAIERKVLPAGHADLAVSLDLLAGMYSEREDFAAAKVARQQALEVLRKRYGETHWKVTDARLALEDVDRRAGMTPRPAAEAGRGGSPQPGGRVALYQCGPGMARRYRRHGGAGPAQRGAGRAPPRLRPKPEQPGGAARVARGLRRRQAPLEKALAIHKEVLGERHPDYATSLNNLAILLESQGDYAAARPLYEQALAIRKEVLGEHHPDYATSLNNLAALLNSQGDYAAARPLYEQALAIQQGGAGRAPPRLRHQPEQPGRSAQVAGGLRRRQATLRAGPGDQ